MCGSPAFSKRGEGPRAALILRPGTEMHMKLNRYLVCRVVFYIVGLFLLAVGVAFSVNSNLGVSPVNSLPFVVSAISGISMGTCVTAVFCGYVLIQILLLRRDFQMKNLLQVVFASIFGYLVNFAKFLLGSFTIPTYFGSLAMLAISIFFVALGLVFYLSAGIVPMPMEGMALAVTEKVKRFPFHTVKIVLDTASVLLAAALSLVFLGHIDGLREGTLISALACGKVMEILSKPLRPRLEALCFQRKEVAPDGEMAGV